ncbi:MAG TPA: META domain-containing protein [Candidatus Limnocylindrales bacterium]|nr:META domain-containing protein [Candidatus Limnocylindrales bacterium]
MTSVLSSPLRRARVLRLAATALLSAVVGGCHLLAPLPIPTPFVPHSAAPPHLDFTGTAWELAAMSGAPINSPRAPTLEFDLVGSGGATGWSGCDEYGAQITLDGGRATVGAFTMNPQGCQAPTEQLERAYVEALGAVTTYRLEGDLLALDGAGGTLTFRRAVPLPGTTARTLLDALRATPWAVVAGTGVATADVVSPIRFGDYILIGIGQCGFSGRYSLEGESGIEIPEVGYDAMSCGSTEADAARDAVVRLLESTATIDLTDAGTVVLRGGSGELVLEPVD